MSECTLDFASSFDPPPGRAPHTAEHQIHTKVEGERAEKTPLVLVLDGADDAVDLSGVVHSRNTWRCTSRDYLLIFANTRQDTAVHTAGRPEKGTHRHLPARILRLDLVHGLS